MSLSFNKGVQSGGHWASYRHASVMGACAPSALNHHGGHPPSPLVKYGVAPLEPQQCTELGAVRGASGCIFHDCVPGKQKKNNT